MTDDWWIGLYSESDISVYSFTASPYLKTLQMFVHLSHIIIHRRIITVWCLFHNLSEMVQKVLKSNKFQLQQTQTRSFLYFKSQNKFETDMKEEKKVFGLTSRRAVSFNTSVGLTFHNCFHPCCVFRGEREVTQHWLSKPVANLCVCVCVAMLRYVESIRGRNLFLPPEAFFCTVANILALRTDLFLLVRI